VSETETSTNNLEALADFIETNLAIEDRIAMVGHPEDEATKVPVTLETDEEGTRRVRLASDILAELDKRLPGPTRREGTVLVTEVASFIDFVKRFGGDNTIVYADTKALGFTAVLDDHPAGAAPMTDAGFAAWRKHRATYSCPRSPEWITWTANDGRALKQDEFADFLEGRLEDMIAAEGFPKPIDVLGVARQLHIKTKGTFQREVNPTNGDHILVNKQETETGSTVIPRAFLIAVPVFEGGDRYQVEARVRFAIGGAGPVFSYTLHRRAEIERDAFNGVRAVIEKETARLVLAGQP
jgi:uncharacterized protein YfdQ (DUF2303 family)